MGQPDNCIDRDDCMCPQCVWTRDRIAKGLPIVQEIGSPTPFTDLIKKLGEDK